MNCKVMLICDNADPVQLDSLDRAWKAFDDMVASNVVQRVRLLDVALGSTHKVLREWKRTH